MSKKLYVIIRDDLSSAQKAVQAGHAVAEWLIKHPESVWKNGTLVYLVVSNKIHLLNVLAAMWDSCNQYAAFYEPDIGGEITAVACLGKHRVVKNLPLLV